MTMSMPTAKMTVAEVLEAWPETVEVFQRLKTACVGCAMAPFDTMEDVARIYMLDLAQLMAELRTTVETGEQPLSEVEEVDTE
jgi:hybrid cluster-associated redox disulfide protein